MKLLVLISVLATYAYAASPDITPIPGGVQGDGVTTRYWDCCKPSCGWTYGTNLTKAVTTCAIDGVTPVGDGEQSGCDGEKLGNAFTCNNNQPWVVSDTLAYGFVAASFQGGVDFSHCCECVLLNFQGQLLGKSLLGIITNTGSDLKNNHFDIEIPGGGVGLFPLGCHRQWGADATNGWGERYGGITTEAECATLPAALQPGCHFRWTFLEGVANPDVKFYQVQCPKELLDITGCQRSD